MTYPKITLKRVVLHSASDPVISITDVEVWERDHTYLLIEPKYGRKTIYKSELHLDLSPTYSNPAVYGDFHSVFYCLPDEGIMLRVILKYLKKYRDSFLDYQKKLAIVSGRVDTAMVELHDKILTYATGVDGSGHMADLSATMEETSK